MTNIRNLICAALAVLALPAQADVTYVVKGVDETLQANVLRHVDTVQFGPQIRLHPHDHEKVIEQAAADARVALRPFGYYAPQITGRVITDGGDSAVVELTIDAGPPIRITSLDVRITGPGAQDSRLRSWRAAWPLNDGVILDQSVWEAQKQDAIEIANARGYLGADFTEHALEIDLEKSSASIRLVFDTGPRYVMGDVTFGPHVLKQGILEYIPRFGTGDPYSARLVGWLRTDLWKTGYFDDVQVIEVERPDTSPPSVDFNVTVETNTRNYYSGALGYGTDSGIRLQANWSRHPISSYGDRIDVGVGYQELNDEFTMRGRYLMPRVNRARQWWDTVLTLKFENLDLEVRRDEEDEDAIGLANGDLVERHLRFGRLKVRNRKGGESQHFFTPFVQFLNNDRRFELFSDVVVPAPVADDPDFDRRLDDVTNALSVGAELELVNIQGRRFETYGHRDLGWIFHSDNAFGSDVEFTQLYASTRRSYLVGERLKFHVRGEVGYTDAVVDEFELDVGGAPLHLSLTRLPNFYRFKAGGSTSVRGYGFERLSDNDVGSNHVITASAEAEYRFLDSWSGALFYDIGNAFNDWDDPDLKRGIGVGIRWYSIAGEIRVDVAQAQDFDGKPWRLHITIGTPLL